MKKIVLSLLLCFAAVNAFALTAEEVYEKSSESDLINLRSKSITYIIEYQLNLEMSSSSIRNAVEEEFNAFFRNLVYRHIVDGDKQRMDVTYTDPEKPDRIFRYSVIMLTDVSYVSVKVKDQNGERNFIDYKVLHSTEGLMDMQSVSSQAESGKISRQEQNAKKVQEFEDRYAKFLEHFEYTFDKDAAKSGKNYIVNHSVKDKKKVIKNAFDKKNKGEELSSEESWLLLSALFNSQYTISKDRYLTQSKELLIDKEASDYAEELNKEKNKDKDKDKDKDKSSQQQKAQDENFTFKFTYSDYKSVEGTKYMYPSFMSIKIEFGDLLCKYAMLTREFRIVSSEDIAGEFVPTNIKKGKGRLPSALTFNSVSAGDIMREAKDEFMKSMRESIKESIKEAAKEEGKNMLKKGVKGAFKGLTGF